MPTIHHDYKTHTFLPIKKNLTKQNLTLDWNYHIFFYIKQFLSIFFISCTGTLIHKKKNHPFSLVDKIFNI